MAKKPIEIRVPEGRQAAYEKVPVDRLQEAFGVSDVALRQQKINEIAELLWVHEDASEATTHERVVRALELYESLEPADGAEGMLAMQMVGTHDAALECLKRAALSNQTLAGRDMALKHAHKLMTLYTQQLATLNKHRGKGQQKVTVEHVNVQAGGQAIVGHVVHGAAGTHEPPPAALDHKDMSVHDVSPAKAKAKAKKRKS